MLEEHLKRLSDDLGIPALAPKDKESRFFLPLSPDLVLTVQDLSKTIFLSASVGPAPLVKKEDAFLLLMKANLLGQGTGDQALGLDPEEKFLTLSCTIPYEINYKEFKEKIEDFANYLAYWREENERLQREASESLL